MKAALLLGLAAGLSLSACGGEVEPDTAESRAEDAEAAAASPEAAATADEDDDGVALDEEGRMIRDAPPQNSRYTDLGDCETVREYEEGGGFEARCEGAGEWTLTYTQSDLRENLVLVDGEGEETSLDLSASLANGAFNDLGRTLEWRMGEDGTAARALIFRLNVARPDPMAADDSKLGVVRLDGPVCLIGSVPPGPGQNVAARKLADRDPLPDCLGRPERTRDAAD